MNIYTSTSIPTPLPPPSSTHPPICPVAVCAHYGITLRVLEDVGQGYNKEYTHKTAFFDTAGRTSGGGKGGKTASNSSEESDDAGTF